MSGTTGYDQLRAATVRQVAQLMAAAAITAPKSGGRAHRWLIRARASGTKGRSNCPAYCRWPAR